MKTVHINIPDQKAAALEAFVRARGLTLEQWFLQLADQSTFDQLSEMADARDVRPIWEVFADAMKDVPREELTALPKDGAAQIDHYLYGQTKT